MKYAFFDGDKVGNSIRNLLLSNKIGEAEMLSNNIKSAISKIEKEIDACEDIKIILAGGDDVLLAYEADYIEKEILPSIPAIFKEETGLSMSFGLGNTIYESMETLDLSKRYAMMPINQLDTSEENVLVRQPKSTISLLIFADSAYPDPYINVISHWFARKPIQEVVLLKIDSDVGKRRYAEVYLEALKKRIELQLSLMSKSNYLRKKTGSRDEWESIAITLEKPAQMIYRDIAKAIPSIDFKFKIVSYEDLGNFLRKHIENNRNVSIKSVFDITTVKKEFIVDIYTILCVENERDINTFQLVLPPTYSEQDMIHALHCEKTYRYVPVASSSYTADKMVASRKESGNIQDYKLRNASLQIKFDKLQQSNKLMELSLAEGFARFWMTVAFFVAVLPCCVLLALLALKGWNDFEKYTFIVPVIVYFFTGFFLQAFFGRKLSINPLSIYENLKSWKLRRISKEINEK
ncbi:mCpol domain-containing protein [Leptothoe sp. EHU-05/26/07-4]